MGVEVSYVAGPRMEHAVGPDRRFTGEKKVVLSVEFGKRRTQYLVELSERDLLRIASGALDMLDQLRRARDTEED